MFCCSWKFSAGTTTEKVMFYPFFFQTYFLFVNHLVNNQGIWLVVVERGSWYFAHCCGMWSEGNKEKNTK